jgi:hypothetical protein
VVYLPLPYILHSSVIQATDGMKLLKIWFTTYTKFLSARNCSKQEEW